MHPSSRSRLAGRLVALLGLPLVAVHGGLASGQVPTVDPGGAAPAAPPASAPAEPPPAGGAPAGESGYYYMDGPDAPVEQPTYGGPPPETHTVRKGDTLWGISGYYFANPWEWPRVWSYNPSITNPHWIYPGDSIRLYRPGEAPAAPAPAPAAASATRREERRSSGVSLRQTAFVDVDELEFSGRIAGSPEEKALLAQGDQVFVDYPAGNPPRVGGRYAIYAPEKHVVHPETGRKQGAYVTLLGEVEIREVSKGRRARGEIIASTDVIERGHRVGPARTIFKQVVPVPADRDLQGVIVAVLGSRELVGADQLVFIDRGTDHGLKVGNRLLVVRSGDAYAGRRKDTIGQDDARFPESVIAQVTVVDVGRTSAVAVVDYAAQEAGIGDRAVLRKGK